MSGIVGIVDKALLALFVWMVSDRRWTGWSHVSWLLGCLMRQRREHVHVPFATVGPYRSDIVSINNLVVFERVKVVLDMDRCLLDDPGAEEGIRGRR